MPLSVAATSSAAIFLAAAGLYAFCLGFLLTRTTFETASACHPDFATAAAEDLDLSPTSAIPGYFEKIYPASFIPSPSSACNGVPPLVDSIAIVIVDALRIDFAVNSLPRTIPALTERSSFGTHRQLLKFHSDPPTVTTQRLQALTTGGLPTFGDVRSSFDAGKVTEDSWLNQLRLQNPNASIFFAGDDTWTKLFPPSYFTSSHPFPSFNTRDIDTVDKGIESVLDEMLTTPSYKISILHFLGVDHVGHTFGPDSPEMAAKLAYTDNVLTDSNLSNPTSSTLCSVSFTFGDHGMTSTGNHGGGSEDETTAGLYASYSPACNFPSSPLDGAETATSSDFTTISQVDIVPTISFLLSLPIPYASIGSVATNLIPNLDSVQMTGILLLNCAQVSSYLRTYGASSRKLRLKVSHLEDILTDAVNTLEEAVGEGGGDSIKMRSAANKMKRYLREATESGREVWTQFGDLEMILGVSLMFLAFILSSCATSAFRIEKVHDSLLAFLTLFLTILIPLSNSYIENAQKITMYSITLTFVVVMLRDLDEIKMTLKSIGEYMIVPLLCRCLEDFTGGHGKLESLWHSTTVRFPLVLILVVLRVKLDGNVVRKITEGHTININPATDVISIILLTISWSYPSTELCYLLYNSSFVDGSDFSFYKSGFLLFLNTFTPHIVTSIMLNINPCISLASVAGCSFSVYLFRRHLMIFGVFAPYWCFACIFAVLNWGVYVLDTAFGGGGGRAQESRKKKT
ncbi:hypothetical protein TrST_g9146 [Triparma strigata]|uniref:GPI ethanolamine phosphate transferase 3 n=1 Tax=Triparma strigata TaxID=1606541 RepID=A0A9W7F2L8_9STRA|nr:hypothetical protein TrST_g9146 [Triparma strigata]